jgi:hypothetical protein
MNESDPERERFSGEPDVSFEGRRPENSESDSWADRVAVLVVHGVAAKVPNREFSNLESVTDPRLQFLMRVHQGVAQVGMATVCETVTKPASVRTIRHYLPEFAETRQNSCS